MTPTPETGTARIRWKQGDDRTFAVSYGYVGTIETEQFGLYEPDEQAGDSHAAEWLLTSRLAGQDRMRYGVDRHKLEAEAERWLSEIVASLGAIFGDAVAADLRSHASEVEGYADGGDEGRHDRSMFATGMRRAADLVEHGDVPAAAGSAKETGQ